MSRKHYIQVAAILAENNDGPDPTKRIALELALMFKRDNPSFDAGRFFDAAGFPELTATRQGLN